MTSPPDQPGPYGYGDNPPNQPPPAGGPGGVPSDGYGVPGYPTYPQDPFGTPAGAPDPLISPDYNGWFSRATQIVKVGWRPLDSESTVATGAVILSALLSSVITALISGAAAVFTAPLTLTAYADMRARVEPVTTAILAAEIGVQQPPPPTYA